MARHPVSDQTTNIAHGRGGSGSRVLVFWDGGFTSRDLAEGGTVIVGRAIECDVSIGHPSVSRRHLAVHAGTELTVEDLGSANGSLLAGKRLQPHVATPVPPGAVVEVGCAMVVVQAPSSGPAVGQAPGAESPIKRLERLSALVAASGLSVLVIGETGVGKEVLAERIHRGSPRAAGPLLKLNCAAMPEALLESELFGHERGAFTGATKNKPGLLEVASGGSVFLDEVADLPLGTQAKLLRVLESREVMPLGGLRARPIDVRFIAAANRDLQLMIESGTFRQDLYFRLNGITLEIPPLRERRDEIRGLAQRFLAARAAATGTAVPVLTADALWALEHHSWPGNVRELRNVIERAFVLSGGREIAPEHFGLDVGASRADPGPSGVDPLRQDVAAFERARIIEALERADGNQTKAAELLGVSRRTLVSRLTSYGLTRARDKT